MPEEEIPQLIKDGLTQGMIPQIVDVPEAMSAVLSKHSKDLWQGDPKSGELARMFLARQKQFLWGIDQIILLPHEKRMEAFKRLQAAMKKK